MWKFLIGFNSKIFYLPKRKIKCCHNSSKYLQTVVVHGDAVQRKDLHQQAVLQKIWKGLKKVSGCCIRNYWAFNMLTAQYPSIKDYIPKYNFLDDTICCCQTLLIQIIFFCRSCLNVCLGECLESNWIWGCDPSSLGLMEEMIWTFSLYSLILQGNLLSTPQVLFEILRCKSARSQM